MSDLITLVVVEDHPLFRQGVVDSLSLEADFHVIGQASTGDDGLELIRRLNPKIALMDINLPGMNGQQVTRQLGVEKISTRVILLTAYADIQQKIYAMRMGAAAYCTKDIPPEQLNWVIRQVASGFIVIDQQVMDVASLEQWMNAHGDGLVSTLVDTIDVFQPLSAREMEVLKHVTRGLSNKEIASSLGISHQTVKNHVTAILRKLGVSDRTQAALYAIRRGWVRLNQQENIQE